MAAKHFAAVVMFLIVCQDLAIANPGDDFDLVILFESSDDSRSTNFVEEKRFLSRLVRQMFPSNNRIALYTFGKSTYSQFSLDMYSSPQDILQAIQYMWFSTGNGALAPAINFTIADAFQSTGGDRECTANSMLIVTHSAIIDSDQALTLAEQLVDKMVTTFILNMAGPSANLNFETLTNDSSRVIDIANWTVLQNMSLSVANSLKSDVGSTDCGRLTQWQPWTGCSRTCGYGFTFRTRQCQKKNPSDKDCIGDFSENKPCFLTACTDPIDGNWAFWGNWGSCSKTCGKGLQHRARSCTLPAPANGGKACPGNNTQTKTCADYDCPNCNAPCPPGAHRSQDCKICECSSLTLNGKVMDDNSEIVQNASIFLESSKYSPLATTDEFGLFQISGVCLMNERVFITAEHCADAHITPKEVNATHWTLPDFKLDAYVPPTLTVEPEDKIRMVGQSLSLCCSGIGRPKPTVFKWYKNGIEIENAGLNGTLYFHTTLTKGDSGTYKCSTETEAGITESREADVEVKDSGSSDTCGSPVSQLETLPSGCFVAGDVNRDNTVDIGTCGKLPCMRSSLHDNGSCSDYWPHHCCDVKIVESIGIDCVTFNYTISRVKSCECKPCMFKTVLSGRAFGRQNDTDVPLRLGDIIINGKKFATTNMGGFFKMDFPKGIRRVVATFHDQIFKKFTDVTKVIEVNEGSDTFATIVVPLKPVPIPFASNNGTEINLGGNKHTPPAAKLSIQPDSIVTADGKTFNGNVKASLHFMDPRNRDDMDAANGDFESEGPDGSKVPLSTFGMFKFDMTDDNGTDLTVNKPLKFSLDASLFDVPLDENGEPQLSVWNYDQNKGTWVEIAKMKKNPVVTGRKLLAASETYIVDYRQPVIPILNQYNQRTVTNKIITGYTNCDHSVPIYGYRTVTIREPKAGACFVSVSVYKDLTLKQAYDAGDIEIKTYVQNPGSTSYIGTSSIKVLRNGHACIPTLCQKNVYIHVVRNSKERLYPGKHYLPHPGYITQTKDNEILFVSNDVGSHFDKTSSLYTPNTLFKGPMFQLADKFSCSRLTALDNHFTFKFAPFTKAPTLNTVAGIGNYDAKKAWYPVSPASVTFRSCFMKLRVKVTDAADLRIIATSFLQDTKGDQFGSYDVGPIPDPRKDDITMRGACFEFRCPGLINDGNNFYMNYSTAVKVQLLSSSNFKCQMREVKNGLNVQPIQDPTKGDIGLIFTAEPGNNYGSKYGVFVEDKTSKETEQFCNSGVNFGRNLDGMMNPFSNAAAFFDCTK